MPHTRFDDSAIHWQTLGDFPHFVYAIQHVDMVQRIADITIETLQALFEARR